MPPLKIHSKVTFALVVAYFIQNRSRNAAKLQLQFFTPCLGDFASHTLPDLDTQVQLYQSPEEPDTACIPLSAVELVTDL